MNELLIAIGWNVDHAFYPEVIATTFWSSPLGLFCSMSLCLTSIFRVMHQRSTADLFDVLWHLAMTVTCGAAFIIGLQHNAPHHLVKTLLLLMTVRGIYKAWRTARYC